MLERRPSQLSHYHSQQDLSPYASKILPSNGSRSKTNTPLRGIKTRTMDFNLNIMTSPGNSEVR